jgi:hypothetical protein
MRLKTKRSKALEFNERDKLVLFLWRMHEFTNRRYYKETDWKVTTGALSLKVTDDDTFAAFLLSFRHFYANDSPTEMGKIHGILSKVAHTSGDAGTLAELVKIKQEFAKGPLLRIDIFDTKGTVIEKFKNDQIFDLYINCRYFHTDPRGAEFFFKMPERSRTTCYHAFQMALIRYIIRFHAYVPIIVRFLDSSALPQGRFDVNPANHGQVITLVKVPKRSPV